jgi:hypothetical protein
MILVLRTFASSLVFTIQTLRVPGVLRGTLLGILHWLSHREHLFSREIHVVDLPRMPLDRRNQPLVALFAYDGTAVAGHLFFPHRILPVLEMCCRRLRRSR